MRGDARRPLAVLYSHTSPSDHIFHYLEFVRLIYLFHRHVLRFLAAPAEVSLVCLTFKPLRISHLAENGLQNVSDK